MRKSFKKQSTEAEELEKSYQLPEIVRQRQHTLNKLSVKRGEKILDVGCGVGFLSYEIGLQTGDSGRVSGIDQNSEMIRRAKKRCENLRNTKFSEANADDLPFPEESFDAACCTQVLLYVKDVAKVISEIKRVLKPAGRIIVVETDWRGVVLNSDYDSITRKIFSAWDKTVQSPNLPVRLAPLLLSNGFCKIDVDPIPILNTEYTPSQFSHGMMNWITRNALKKGVITKEQSKKWLDDLDVKGESGNYFFCVNRFLFSGQMA
ncbi:methyltransferase domain-containing protein [Deltaproteobacteria bacterium]|nr:methyltransferase domain-containing protein [Deltaproteobacteria bacterium]